jgi:hypothetical protein
MAPLIITNKRARGKDCRVSLAGTEVMMFLGSSEANNAIGGGSRHGVAINRLAIFVNGAGTAERLAPTELCAGECYVVEHVPEKLQIRITIERATD